MGPAHHRHAQRTTLAPLILQVPSTERARDCAREVLILAGRMRATPLAYEHDPGYNPRLVLDLPPFLHRERPSEVGRRAP